MLERSSESESVNYQDYVIRDGQFIGRFDELYRDFDDPWEQSAPASVFDPRRSRAIEACRGLRSDYGAENVDRTLEIGCGFGFLTATLAREGFAAVGVDVSKEAITRARKIHPGVVYLRRGITDPGLLEDFDPDVVILAEVTWYVLESLAEFVQQLRNFARSRGRPVHVIHLLTTYPPGVQKYGREYFTDLTGILAFFDLEYLDTQVLSVGEDGEGGGHLTYFLARA